MLELEIALERTSIRALLRYVIYVIYVIYKAQ